jgi:glucose/mannose-6-phosphate isomerase
MTVDLDDPKLVDRLDPQGMGAMITGLPDQCRPAWDDAQALPLPDIHRGLDRVVVLGIGGSAIGGDLVADLQRFHGDRPVQVHRGYGAEGLADERTLAIASSYSGNTEETFEAFKHALGRGALGLAITRGGQLADYCKDAGLPCLSVDFVGPPRASLGASVFSLLGLLAQLGYVRVNAKEVDDAVELARRQVELLAPGVPTAENKAKRLALAIGDRTLVICGAQHLTGVARRWKTQVAENAKRWAFAEELPEFQHNSVEGVNVLPSPSGAVFVILLRSDLFDPRVARRFDLTGELLEHSKTSHEDVEALGESALAQIMTTTLFGDFVSYYLALLRNVDPTPTPNLDWLKRRMTEG